MKRRGWRNATLAVLVFLAAGLGPVGPRAAPLPYEVACDYARTTLWRMLLICDDGYLWCWSGWEYLGDEGGMSHYGCGSNY